MVKISEVLDNFFGWGKIGLSLSLLLLAFSFSKIKIKLAKANVLVGFTLSWLTFLGLTKSGRIGREIWTNIESLITAPGAFLVFIGSLIIGLVVLFNTSIDEILIFLVKVFTLIFEFFKKYIFKPRPKPFITQEKLPLKIKEPILPALMPQKNVVTKEEIKKSGLESTIKTEKNLISDIPLQKRVWQHPPLSILEDFSEYKADRGDIKTNAQIIERTLDSFGIRAQVIEVNKGPAVTQYAIKIAEGTKLSKITALANDLALALAAPTGQIRIEAPIPGRSLIGIEIPNRSPELVSLKRILTSEEMKNAKSKLTVALGLNVSGEPVVADITKMPHTLIAGTTGSGKSVLINSFIASLLFRTTPEEVRLILVDPKRVELIVYNGIPHLFTPVIVEVEEILKVLKWAMIEMEKRYKKFAAAKVRNIESYNEMAGFQAIPYIVIIIDELADVMAYAPVEVEDAICRLAQMARATGIHLIVSTQRPSVDVITGLIKANIPCRIAFNVSSMVDSRVIIDMPGAEKLLGRGDMLFIPPDQAKPTRIQGAFVSEREIQRLVEFLKAQNYPVNYTEEIKDIQIASLKKEGEEEDKDELFNEAVKVVCQYDRASASLLQRRLSIGYARAARIIDQLEAAGIVGPGEGSKPRDVLVRNAEEYLAQKAQESNP